MSRILRRPMFRGGPVDSYGTGIATGLGTRSGYYRGGGVSYNPFNKAQTSNLLGRNTPKALPDLSQFGESRISSIFNPVQITPKGFQQSSPMPGSDEYAMMMKNLYPESDYGKPISEEDIEESLKQGGIFDSYTFEGGYRKGKDMDLEPSSRIEEGLFGSGVFDKSDRFRERAGKPYIPFDEPASTSPELEAIRQQNIADLENIDKMDNSPKEVKTPNVNKTDETDETDETEVTMTDLEKALGLDKARRRDLGDMLGRASAAFLGAGDVRGGLAEFMAAEAKAGPSRTERIKSIAGLEEFKAKKAQELYEAKLTATLKQKQGTKGSLQKDIEYLGTLSGADRIAALGKLGYKAPSLSAAIKELKITGQAPDPATIINLATLYIGPDFQGVVDVTEEMSGKAAGTYITTDATALIIVDEQGNTRLQKL